MHHLSTLWRCIAFVVLRVLSVTFHPSSPAALAQDPPHITGEITEYSCSSYTVLYDSEVPVTLRAEVVIETTTAFPVYLASESQQVTGEGTMTFPFVMPADATGYTRVGLYLDNPDGVTVVSREFTFNCSQQQPYTPVFSISQITCGSASVNYNTERSVNIRYYVADTSGSDWIFYLNETASDVQDSGSLVFTFAIPDGVTDVILGAEIELNEENGGQVALIATRWSADCIPAPTPEPTDPQINEPSASPVAPTATTDTSEPGGSVVKLPSTGSGSAAGTVDLLLAGLGMICTLLACAVPVRRRHLFNC